MYEERPVPGDRITAVARVHRFKRILMAGATAGLLTVGLAACGGGSGGAATGGIGAAAGGSSGSSAGVSTSKQALTFATSAYPASFDLYASTDTVSTYIWRSWWEYLVRPSQSGGGFDPQLATSWNIANDGRTYIFHLRHDVKFTNGEPFTAADVVYSWNRAFTTSTSTLTFLKPKIKSMTAMGPYTVKVDFVKPWHYFLDEICCDMGAVIPKQLVEKEGYKKFVQHPVGTGPFEISKVDPGNSLTVAANPHYWEAGYPKLHSITFQAIGDDTARAQAVEGGRAQLAEQPPPNQLASLKHNSALKVLTFPNASVELIAINTKVKPLNNLKVRQAISLAINRAGITSAGLFGTATQSKTFIVPPASYTYEETNTNLYPFDVAKAKQLIAASGVKTPINLKFTVSEGSVQTIIGEVVINDLKQIGINVQLERGQVSATDTAIGNGKYQMSTTNWQDFQPDPSVQPLFAIDPKYCCDAFYSGYDDPTEVSLLHQAVDSSSSTQRKSLFAQVQQRFAQSSYVLPLYDPELTYVASPSLTGFFAYPNNLFAYEQWSLK